MPEIGIALPAYDAARTLEETLRSCVAQTFTDFVVHVTVDADAAVEEEAIVARIGDPRIVLTLNGKRLGQPWNFNRATLACLRDGAKWIKFLSADDVLAPDALERMLAIGRSLPTCGLVFGFYDVIDVDGLVTDEVDLSQTPARTWTSAEFFDEALSWGNPMGGPSSVMVRAEAIERAGLFDDCFPWGMDQILWYRILRTFDAGMVGERPILAYRVHGNSVSARMRESAARFSDPIQLGADVSLGCAPGTKRRRRSAPPAPR